MRIGIMGGSFDPIHIGHLLAATCAQEEAELDQVWFMPSYTPPHKAESETGAADRMAMTRLALLDNPCFQVSDMEMTREGTSYSYDTAAALLAERPNDTFYWIIGADMIRYLPKWHRIEELLDLISFIGLQRPGYPVDWGELSPSMRTGVSVVPMPQFDVSSSMIRARLDQGKTCRYLLPQGVVEYIKEKHLYDY